MSLASYHDFGVELVPMQQLSEALNDNDDWTGLKDAKERRKRQNRLHQRAYRRRRALEAKAAQASDSDAPTTTLPFHPHPRNAARQNPAVIPLGAALAASHGRGPVAVQYFPLTPDHELLTVIRLNVARGILTNYSILATIPSWTVGIVAPCRELHIFVYPAPEDTPSLAEGTHKTRQQAAFPLQFRSTYVQQTVPHLPWIDMFPSPRFRDNIILGLAEGLVDEDELVWDLVGSVFGRTGCKPENDHSDIKEIMEEYNEGVSEPRRQQRGKRAVSKSALKGEPSGATAQPIRDEAGMLSWSDPWDISGWEFTEHFLRKWRFLLRGCSDVLTATNKWRALRGEDPLLLDI